MIRRKCAARSKAGFTLMELVVYMGIVGIVVIIAGEAFSNSTKFRIRTDNMIKANQEAENVAMLFKEDVEQLGVKAMGDNALTSVGNRIYMDPENEDDNKKDLSSFLVQKNNPIYSSLTFKRIRYNDEGLYQAIDSVRWFVENGVLKRSCWVLEQADGFTLPEDDPCVNEKKDPTPVEMATGVSIFNIEAASPSTKEDLAQMFPPEHSSQFILVPRLDAGGEYGKEFVPFNSTNDEDENLGAGSTIKLSGFWSNYNNSENKILIEGEQKVNQVIAIGGNASNVENSDWKTLCLEFGSLKFAPDTVYEISFIVATPSSRDNSTNFVPAKDHMSVGFRSAASGDYIRSKDGSNRVILPDFLFFPPLDNNKEEGNTSMRFTVPEHVNNACLAFSFALYSPLASLGNVTIKNLKVSQVASANYKFKGIDPELDKKEKKNIKALKLRLQVSRGAKNNGKGETGDVDLIIPIPSNGTGD